jgi:hypothetical protein
MKFRLALVLLAAMVLAPVCAMAKSKCSVVVDKKVSVRVGSKILSAKVKNKSICSAKISKKKIVVKGKKVGKTKIVVRLKNGKKTVVRVVVSMPARTADVPATEQPTTTPAVTDDGDDEGTVIRGENLGDEAVPVVSTATPEPEVDDDDDNWWVW